MKFSLQREGDIPLYRQIAHQIREYIRSGALAPGERLPTVRHLSHEYRLTPISPAGTNGARGSSLYVA